MGFDNELNEKLMAEPRVFMNGLSDEAGAAQPLAIASKQLGMPDGIEIQKLEAYVHETLFRGGKGSRRKKDSYIQVIYAPYMIILIIMTKNAG